MARTKDTREVAGATAGLRRALRELEAEVARTMRINLDPAGLTVEEWAVLDLLSDGQGHPMADVVAAVGLPAPSVTRLVDRLVGKALLHRAVAPHDRRKVLVVLAPAGRELYDKVAPGQARLAEMLDVRVGGLDALAARLGEASAALRAQG